MSSGTSPLTRPPLSVATVGLDKYSVAAIRDAIGKLSAFGLTAEFPPFDTDTATAYVADCLQQQRRFDIYIVDFDTDRQKAVAVAELIRSKLPGSDVFAISKNADPDLIIQAMHAGCAEYLTLPLVKDRVVQSLIRLEHRRKEVSPVKKGLVHTLLGAKGGTGVTMLATHIAAYAAQQGIKTLLIDQHPDLGDVAVYLRLGEQPYHFYELINNVHRLDAHLLDGFVVHHGSKLDVLPAPEKFGTTIQVTPTSLQHTISFLQDVYDLVIVDCAPGLSGANLACIEQCNTVYLVATPELAAIRNLARCLDHLQRYNCADNKLQIVINRYSKKAAISQQQIQRAIQRSVDISIPNSYPDVIGAIHSGEPMPMGSQSELVVALRGWAASLAQTAQPAIEPVRIPKRRFGILGI